MTDLNMVSSRKVNVNILLHTDLCREICFVAGILVILAMTTQQTITATTATDIYFLQC